MDSTKLDIEQIDLFSVPIWRFRLPEMQPYEAQLRQQMLQQWEAGAFQKHQFGYGYQTSSVLFDRDNLAASPALQTLQQAFASRVRQILRQRVNHTVHLPPDVYAYMAWALVQTNEDWVNGTWHDHAPALISGCYYLQQPETAHDTEGALAFQRPGSVDSFVRQVQYVQPQQGDFILFPSYLSHRPTPCPSARELRISINMDAYVHWLHWDESGKPRIHPERYRQLREDSL
ncbi:MAG: putative 2OG-Fe(II) oxygenase [Gammaproteobacteria bacterium]|jgi:uncharacterized protein (TIGR02466 family)|nr:putative 2OG-Fe(II) oxygenase [Gammaproteobacteria bacterium]